MTLSRCLRASTALLAVAGLLQTQNAFAQTATTAAAMTVMPDSSRFVKQYASVPSLAPQLTYAQKQALLKQKIKYVFVLFQENRSYDQRVRHLPGRQRPVFAGGKLEAPTPLGRCRRSSTRTARSARSRPS